VKGQAIIRTITAAEIITVQNNDIQTVQNHVRVIRGPSLTKCRTKCWIT